MLVLKTGGGGDGRCTREDVVL